jgi:hypothetical protein
LTFSGDELRGMSSDDLDAVAEELAAAIAGEGGSERESERAGAEEEPPATRFEDRHDAPDLEALVPREVAGTRLQVTSVRASEWDSVLLRQAIDATGGDPEESFVAIGLGGTGDDTMAITMYAIPGVPQDRLEAEFGRDAYLPPGQRWQRREVGGKPVWWANAPDFDTAFYALGGLVVTVGGSPERVLAALDVLP